MGKKSEAIKATAGDTWLSAAFTYLAFEAKLPPLVGNIIGKIIWPVGFVLEFVGLAQIINKIANDVTDWEILRAIKSRDKLDNITTLDEKFNQYGLPKERRDQLTTGWRNVVNATVNTLTLAGKAGALAGCGLLAAIAIYGVTTIAPWLIPACFMVALGSAAISNVIRAIEENKLLKGKTPGSKPHKDSITNIKALSVKAALCAAACFMVFTSLFAPAFPALAAWTAASLISHLPLVVIPAFLTAPMISLLVGAVAAAGMVVTKICSSNKISNRKATGEERGLLAGTTPSAALGAAGVKSGASSQLGDAPSRNPITRLFGSCVPRRQPAAAAPLRKGQDVVDTHLCAP
jgi:hypothetical protein